MKNILLKIADINIQIESMDSDLELILDENHEPFVYGLNENEIVDLKLGVQKHIPKEFSLLPEVFKSKIVLNDEDIVWRVVESSENEYVFQFYLHTETRPSIALMMSDSNEWLLYTDVVSSSGTVNPLQYPVGTILLYYLLLKKDGFLLHGSGIFDGNKGRIFTGKSGVGKSTISQLWKDSGAIRVQDDRLIIREIEGAYFMFNSPMLVPEEPKKAPVSDVFFISHGKQNEALQLSALDGFAKIIPNCVQHHFNEGFIQSFVGRVNDFSRHVRFCNLGFLPDSSVVDYIKDLK